MVGNNSVFISASGLVVNLEGAKFMRPKVEFTHNYIYEQAPSIPVPMAHINPDGSVTHYWNYVSRGEYALPTAILKYNKVLG